MKRLAALLLLGLAPLMGRAEETTWYPISSSPTNRYYNCALATSFKDPDPSYLSLAPVSNVQVSASQFTTAYDWSDAITAKSERTVKDPKSGFSMTVSGKWLYSSTFAFETFSPLTFKITPTEGHVSSGFLVSWMNSTNGIGYAETVSRSETNRYCVSSVRGDFVARWLVIPLMRPARTFYFDMGGGEAIEPRVETEGEYGPLGVLLPTTGTRKNFTFSGWETTTGEDITTPYYNPDPTEGNIATGVTVVARWTRYPEVWFNALGGTPSEETRSVAPGEAVGPLPTAVKPGYTFSGWYTKSVGGELCTEYDEIDDDVTYFAHWEPISYSIHFDPSGGTGTMADMTGVVYGTVTNLTANAFERFGYSFSRWVGPDKREYMDRSEVTNLTTNNGECVTLTASWAPKYFWVHFDTNEKDAGIGTIRGSMPDQRFILGEEAALSPCAFASTNHFHQIGWSDSSTGELRWKDGAPFVSTVAAENSVTNLYAVWEENRYNIAFDPGEGSGTMPDMTGIICTVATELRECTFTPRTGYTFDYWLDTETGIRYGNKEPVTALREAQNATAVLQAQWKPVSYKVQYWKRPTNKGLKEYASLTTNVYYDTSFELARVEDWAFMGWQTDTNRLDQVEYEGGTTVSNLPYVVSGGERFINLYAVWRVLSLQEALGCDNLNFTTNSVSRKMWEVGSDGVSLPENFLVTSPLILSATNLLSGGELTFTYSLKDSNINRAVTFITQNENTRLPDTGGTNATLSVAVTITPGASADISWSAKANMAGMEFNLKSVSWTCGHTWYETCGAQEATCTTDGYTSARRCKACGALFDVEGFTPAGHIPETVAGREPTCTEPGYTESVVCARCGLVLEAREEIPALGHDPEEVAGREPTCTEPGYTASIVCARCGVVLEAREEIPALGHDPETFAAKAPTFTSPGYTESIVCRRCGLVLKAREEIPALDHLTVGTAVTLSLSELIGIEPSVTPRATGLPSGLRLARVNGVWTITGTPTTELTGVNDCVYVTVGTEVYPVSLPVRAEAARTFILRESVAETVESDVTAISGLPTGLRFTRKTLSLSGAPTRTGLFLVSTTRNGVVTRSYWRVTDPDNTGVLDRIDFGGAEKGPYAVTNQMGLATVWTIGTLENGARLTVSGLPTGLKLTSIYDRANQLYTYTVSGLPIRAGSFIVTFRTTREGCTVTERYLVVIADIPDWAKGVFLGVLTNEAAEVVGRAEVTAGSTASITARCYLGTASGSGTIRGFSETSDALRRAVGAVRISRVDYPLVLDFCADDEAAGLRGALGDWGLVGWVNPWKTAERLKAFRLFYAQLLQAKGVRTLTATDEETGVQMTLSSSGAVTCRHTASGTSSSTVLLDPVFGESSISGKVIIYLNPRAAKGFAGCYQVKEVTFE